MQGLARVIEHASIDPAILTQVATDPDGIIEKFDLSTDEAKALKSNDFDRFAGQFGVDRSRRASNHDDAYLS